MYRRFTRASMLFVSLCGCTQKVDVTTEEDSDRHPTLEDCPLVKTDVIPYTVSVNGEKLHVKRMGHFDVPVNFVRMDIREGMEIEIAANETIDSFVLSPKKWEIDATHKKDTITFAIDEPKYLILQPHSIDKKMENLILLVDPAENNAPDPSARNIVNIMDFDDIDPCGESLMTDRIQHAIDSLEGTRKTLYFPAGTYLTGELWMRSGMRLYLSDGAVLKASSKLDDIVTEEKTGSTIEECLHALIRMYDVTDSHIGGRGVIDANGAFHRDEEQPRTKYNLLKIEESSNCSVDGIVALDSSFWSTVVYRSDDIHLTNYKVINNWKNIGWNETDGVDFDNSSNSSLSNAFLYVGDDCMATKSDDIPDGYAPLKDGVYIDPTQSSDYIAVDQILHEDVVCFTNQSACKIGTKTMGGTMKDVVFKNIDVVNCGRGMVIDNMDTATVRDIRFENIEFEFFGPFDAVNFIINEGTTWRDSEGLGTIEDISIDHIVLKDFEGLKPLFLIEGRVDKSTGKSMMVEGIALSDVFLEGVHVVEDNRDDLIRLILKEADDIQFD